MPDIDFNIRAGNTLVGYASYEQTRKAVLGEVQGKMDMEGNMERIDRSAQTVDRDFRNFLSLQQSYGISAREMAVTKDSLKQRLGQLQDELNHHMSGEYGVDFKKPAYADWIKTHHPFHWFVEFYGIMKDGGFDVAIGNPPYVNTNKIDYSVDPSIYKCTGCKDLFALIVERAYSLVRSQGRIGFIIPLSATSTDIMLPLKTQIADSSINIWASYYSASDQPSSLFTGVRHRLLILLSQSGCSKSPVKYGTHFIKWFSEERESLFKTFIEYANISRFRDFCKISTNHEASILTKMLRFKPLSYYLRGHGFPLYYHNAPVHWGKVFDFIPYFKVGNNRPQQSSHIKEIHLTSEQDAAATICLLNSSLFYWFNWLFSNCRDLSLKDVGRVPIGLDMMDAKWKDLLVNLKTKLLTDFMRNTKIYRRVSKGVQTEFDSFYPMRSKKIIDDIDCVLAKHYGFTEEELDFIINYDIKYRMGKDVEEEADS